MLNVVTADEAANIILKDVKMLNDTENVQLESALGRTVSEDIISPEDLPPRARSTVDGYAVKASDTFGCSEAIPAMLRCDGEILMGEMPDGALLPGHCYKISTGGFLPGGADAVSMLEYSDDCGDEFRYIYKPLSVLENVNNLGDDCRKGSIVLGKGTLIGAKHIAICAALGISSLPVYRKLKIAVLSTGDELVDYRKRVSGGKIRNINSVMLAAQLKELDMDPIEYPVIPDKEEELERAVVSAADECDAILISGGSSAGEKDNAVRVLERIGEVRFHGISVKPGKPTIYAYVKGRPVFSLPGHPQAAFFIFRLFAAPALLKMAGKEDHSSRESCILSQNIPSNHGREEIIPVLIKGQEAIPVHSKSGIVSVLAKADGFIRIPRNAEGLKKGETVDVFLL